MVIGPARMIYRDTGQPNLAIPVTRSAADPPHSTAGPAHRAGPEPSRCGTLGIGSDDNAAGCPSEEKQENRWPGPGAMDGEGWKNDSTGYSFDE